jgi:hypothetical protein
VKRIGPKWVTGCSLKDTPKKKRPRRLVLKPLFPHFGFSIPVPVP